jgi:hypothetical protein
MLTGSLTEFEMTGKLAWLGILKQQARVTYVTQAVYAPADAFSMCGQFERAKPEPPRQVFRIQRYPYAYLGDQACGHMLWLKHQQFRRVEGNQA